MRAKFKVQTVQQATYPDKDGVERVHSEQVTMFPVYSDDPASENRAFWEATPSGTLSMWINNKAAFGHFVMGQEYYIDFTLVVA